MAYMNADYAAQIIDAVPRTANAAMREYVEKNLIDNNADPQVALGMLSALKFAHSLLLHKEGSSGPGTAILTDLTTEIAHHYMGLIEQAVSKSA